MKAMKYINRMKALALALLAILSCSTGMDVDDEGLQTCTYRMRFDCSIENASFVMTKAGYPWEDGTVIQMQFQNKSSRIKGLATYSQATGEWTVTTDKTMVAVSDASCEAYWLKGLGDQAADALTLGPEIAPFKDINATYKLDQDGYLLVTAHLAPMTSRVRFIGQPGRSFTVSGLQYISAYSRTGNSFTRVSQDVTVTIGPEGSSGYVYATFANTSERKLTISGEHNTAYVRTFGEDVLVIGNSGYLNVPTPANPGNWSFVNTSNQKEVILPTVSEVNVTGVKGVSAGFAAKVTDLGNSIILSSGFVYGKTPAPTIETALTYSCGSSDSFSVRIGGLDKVTTYYVRAFASNPKGLSYGPEVTFITTDEEDGITSGDFEEGEENWGDNYGEDSDPVTGGSIGKDDWNEDDNWNLNAGGQYPSDGDQIGKDNWPDDDDWNENWGGETDPMDGSDMGKDDWEDDEDWNEE